MNSLNIKIDINNLFLFQLVWIEQVGTRTGNIRCLSKWGGEVPCGALRLGFRTVEVVVTVVVVTVVVEVVVVDSADTDVWWISRLLTCSHL